MFLNVLFLQVDGVTTDIERTAPAPESQSIMDIILSSGPMGIAITLGILVMSVMALYIFITRYMTMQRAGRIDDNFMNNIRSNVSSGNIQAARALCQTNDTPVARMVEKGLQRIGKPLNDIDTAIENVGKLTQTWGSKPW